MPAGDYAPLLDAVARTGDSAAAMQRCADAIWSAFGGRAVSWAGFYLWSADRPDELTLGPRRDKPACSPIGLHGACGRCWSSRRALVVTDVAKLGAGYIACDPRDRAEVVVPLFNPDGSCWGVLDVDSHHPDAFDEFDAASLMRLMRHAGLSAHGPDAEDPALVEIV